ncbi:MAG: GNAT family N-acetyltransferase [Thermoplasmata archaeon]
MDNFRKYDPEKDKEAVHRIWKEIGWINEGDEEKMDAFVKVSNASVTDLDGQPECLVLTVPGTIQYLNEELDLSVVTSVSTSRVARRQGFAAKLTAKAIADDAQEGADVSALGMFEQGFYNRLGYGTGNYENWIYFDPSDLDIDVEPDTPKRITKDDWEEVYEARINRMPRYGRCCILAPKGTKAEMIFTKNDFGLGYFDDKGEITHHMWLGAENVEKGPYSVRWMAYQDYDQFLELIALLRNLSDQINLVRMREPGDIQMQDLLKKPLNKRRITKDSKFENKMSAIAYWQMRILDLKSCLEKTHLRFGLVKFNLDLKDPIENLLPNGTDWRGISGKYTITLGEKSKAEDGFTEGLPELRASIGAFTRMWLGVNKPSGLSVTDELKAPDKLLKGLDRLLNLPDPHPDWDF